MKQAGRAQFSSKRESGEPAGQLSLVLDSAPVAAQPPVFTVSELNASLQRLFVREFRLIAVAGEVSGCRVTTSGHCYFTLKDAESQLKCALFKGNARYLKLKPKDGLAVIASGNLEIYEARGEYQLIVERLEPQGLGALQLAFEQLKRKLAEEGLFEAARKRALPVLPRRIGIVSSPSGAVIRDMLHILERRFPGLHIRLFPALVQGEGSVEQVCRGLRYFSESSWADLVIVARGGGSLEDLWTFNEEAVAREIAACRIPVISAVGHETDFTIADFVADLRAPTPSAAAELAVPTRDSILDQTRSATARLVHHIRFRLLAASHAWHRQGAERAGSGIHRALVKRAQRVDDAEYRLSRLMRGALKLRERRWKDLTERAKMADLRVRLAGLRVRWEALRQRLAVAGRNRVAREQRRYQPADARLAQLSPLAVLGRGYAIVQNGSGRVLRDRNEAHAGERLAVRLHRGQLSVEVVEPPES